MQQWYANVSGAGPSLRASVLFHPFITCVTGETTRHCAAPPQQNVLGPGRVCNHTAGEKMYRTGSESPSVRGFLMLIPRGIFWWARWVTGRVWPARRLLASLLVGTFSWSDWFMRAVWTHKRSSNTLHPIHNYSLEGNTFSDARSFHLF